MASFNPAMLQQMFAPKGGVAPQAGVVPPQVGAVPQGVVPPPSPKKKGKGKGKK